MHAHQALLLLALAATSAAQSLCAPTLAANNMAPAAAAAPSVTTPAALPSAWSEWKGAATVQSPHHANADATVQGPRQLHGAEATVQGPRLYHHKNPHNQADATVQFPAQDADATVQGPVRHATIAAAATVQTQRAAEATVQGPRMAVVTKRRGGSRSSTAFVKRDAIFTTKLQQRDLPSITISGEKSGPTAVGSAREAGATVQGPREVLAARPTAVAAAAWFLAAAS